MDRGPIPGGMGALELVSRPDISPVLPKSLRRLYQDIPQANCKGLCFDQCTVVPCSPLELQEIFREAGTEERKADGKRCPYLSPENRCGIYASRPTICRLFGTVPPGHPIACPHGCKPDSGYLSLRESAAILRRSVEISPGVRSLHPELDGLLFLGNLDP